MILTQNLKVKNRKSVIESMTLREVGEKRNGVSSQEWNTVKQRGYLAVQLKATYHSGHTSPSEEGDIKQMTVMVFRLDT